MIFIKNVISACQLLHGFEGVETWKISLLPTPPFLILVGILSKGHLLVWVSPRQWTTFILCYLPRCSCNPKFAPIPIAVIIINGLKPLSASLKAWGKCLDWVSVTICCMCSSDCICQAFAFIHWVLWCAWTFLLPLNCPQFSLADPERYSGVNEKPWTRLRTPNCPEITQGMFSDFWIRMSHLHWEDALLASTTIYIIQQLELCSDNQASKSEDCCVWLPKFHRKLFTVGHRGGDTD